MKKQTIEKKIRGKFKHWLNSIEDNNVKKLVSENSIVTGGSIVSMFLDEDVNDYDIYFTNRDTVKAVAEYYINLFNKKENGKKAKLDEKEDGSIKIYIKSEGTIKTQQKSSKQYQPVYLTDNSITLSDDIQIIIRFFGTPDEIHENFDFMHCTNYWLSSDNKLYTRKEALECILSKTLFYCGSKYPFCSIIRSRKFIKRGWNINGGQYLKMVMQLNELNLKDFNVLTDQLIGVDIAYFNDLIEILKHQGFSEIDTSFLISKIDEVFDD